MSISHPSKVMDLNHQSKMPFKQDYPVPDGYFDQLSQRVLARMEGVKKLEGARNENMVGWPSAWLLFQGLRGSRPTMAWAVAAFLALVVGGWFLGEVWWSRMNPTFQAMAPSDFFAEVRIEEVYEAVHQETSMELIEEVVETDPACRNLLMTLVDEMNHEPVSLEEAVQTLPNDLSVLVEAAEIEI